MWVVVIITVIVAILLLRKVSNYSLVDMMNEMRGGSAQVNPLADYFQESEKDMLTGPYSEGYGANITDNVRMEDTDKADEYDYTRPPTFDYSKELAKNTIGCRTGENLEDCLKRLYSCKEKETLDVCLAKVCAAGETMDVCLRRIYKCTPSDTLEQCKLQKFTKPVLEKGTCADDDEVCLKTLNKCDANISWDECRKTKFQEISQYIEPLCGDNESPMECKKRLFNEQ